MKFSAEQISGILQGEIEGDPSVEVYKLAKIEEGEEGALTFLANPKYTNYIYETNASIAIVNKTFVAEKPVKPTLIRVDDARECFSRLLEYYNEVKLHKSGREEPLSIADSVKLGENLYLGAYSYIGENSQIGNNVKIYPHVFIGDNVKIGDDCVIFSGARIYSESVLGKECTIHSGAIVGADGFGYTPDANNEFKKVPQIGNVILEDKVDVGANTTVDRATMGSTLIRRGVKLDNLIQIGHNVEIGANTVIAAQTGIAGSTKVGKNCMIGGQVGIAGHLKIGDNVRIAAQSGIGSNVKDNSVIQGSPAFDIKEYLKSYVHYRKLPALVKRVQELEKAIKNI